MFSHEISPDIIYSHEIWPDIWKSLSECRPTDNFMFCLLHHRNSFNPLDPKKIRFEIPGQQGCQWLHPARDFQGHPRNTGAQSPCNKHPQDSHRHHLEVPTWRVQPQFVPQVPATPCKPLPSGQWSMDPCKLVWKKLSGVWICVSSSGKICSPQPQSKDWVLGAGEQLIPWTSGMTPNTKYTIHNITGNGLDTAFQIQSSHPRKSNTKSN